MRFVNETEKYESYLKEIKSACDNFDKEDASPTARTKYVASIKAGFKNVSDAHYSFVWRFLSDNGILADKGLYPEYKKLYYDKLSPLLLYPAVNWQINKKPFGYPGDFVVMNYIYDYHDSTGNYLGDHSFDMLINNYTCSIPIATSNIERKDYFRKYLESAAKTDNLKIASIACGPMREMFDSLKDGSLSGKIKITGFDFEDKVFECLNENLAKYPELPFELNFIKENILNLIKSRDLKNKLAGQDLIYCSGLFDYLSDKFCSKLLKTLFEFLSSNGQLIICNASDEFSSHRAYYDFLGDWELIYRKKDAVLKMADGIDDIKGIDIFQTSKNGGYWFLKLDKK